jgi:hypothetical protein
MLRVKAMPMDEIRFEIDAEIARLQQVRTLLFGSDAVAVKRKPGRPVGSGAAPAAIPVTSPATAQPRRKMSAAGRARIAAAMKMRWAKVRKAAKKAAKPTQAPVVAAAHSKKPAKKVASKKSALKKTAPKKRAAKKATLPQTSVPSPSTT